MVWALSHSGHIELREAPRKPRKVTSNGQAGKGRYTYPIKLISFIGGESLGTVSWGDFQAATGVSFSRSGVAVKLSPPLAKKLVQVTWKGRLKIA